MVIVAVTRNLARRFRDSRSGSRRYPRSLLSTSTALSLIALSALVRHPRLARSRFTLATRRSHGRMVPTGKNNALEIQMTERGGRGAIYQIKAVVQSNTRPCRQWKRQFIFNIKHGRGRGGRRGETRSLPGW